MSDGRVKLPKTNVLPSRVVLDPGEVLEVEVDEEGPWVEGGGLATTCMVLPLTSVMQMDKNIYVFHIQQYGIQALDDPVHITI